MNTTCPGCQSPLAQHGGPHRGPRWQQYACGTVHHDADDDLSRTKECYRRENAELWETLAAEGGQ